MDPWPPLPFLATRCIKTICSGMACLLFFFLFLEPFSTCTAMYKNRNVRCYMPLWPPKHSPPCGHVWFHMLESGEHRGSSALQRNKGWKEPQAYRAGKHLCGTRMVHCWGMHREGVKKALWEIESPIWFVCIWGFNNQREGYGGRAVDGPHPHFSIGRDRGWGQGHPKGWAQTLDFILSTSYLIIRSFSPYKNCYTCLWPSPSQKENLM